MIFSLLTDVGQINITRPGQKVEGIGPLGLLGKNTQEVATLFPQVISNIVGVLTAAAIIWFVFQFIIGAFGWITAGGDQKAVEGARARITNAVIGIIIVAIALVFISLLGSLLGIDILNLKGAICKVLPPGAVGCL